MKEEPEKELVREIKNLKHWLIAVYVVLVLVFWVLVFSGCTKTALKRIVIDPNGLISYTAFTNYECMMKSAMEDAEVVIDGDYRHYAIGSREQWPDPNSIEAAVKAAIEAAK